MGDPEQVFTSAKLPYCNPSFPLLYYLPMAITLAKNNTAERKALDMKSGDTVKVHQKIQEKGKTRIQIFEGLVFLESTEQRRVLHLQYENHQTDGE